jgi:hypothetical protein
MGEENPERQGEARDAALAKELQELEQAARAALASVDPPATPPSVLSHPIEGWLTSCLWGRVSYAFGDFIDNCDFFGREWPTGPDVGYTFFRLRKRGWLVLDGDRFGLTNAAQATVSAVMGQSRPGDTLLEHWDRIENLDLWLKGHPP